MRDGGLRRWAMLVVLAGLVGVSGCGGGVLNPALVASLGGNTASAMDNPQGTIVILLVNRTLSTVQAYVLVTKDNGAAREWPLQVKAFQPGTPNSGWLGFAQECDVASIDVVSFRFSIPGGGDAGDRTADLGTLVVGQSLNCGDVILIRAEGTAPNIIFTVEVF